MWYMSAKWLCTPNLSEFHIFIFISIYWVDWAIAIVVKFQLKFFIHDNRDGMRVALISKCFFRIKILLHKVFLG